MQMRPDFGPMPLLPLRQDWAGVVIAGYLVTQQQSQRQAELPGNEFQAVQRRDIFDAGRSAVIATGKQAFFFNVYADNQFHSGCAILINFQKFIFLSS
jgi:hypothetical protein